MPLVKKTKVVTDMISLRVPLALKTEFIALRKLAEKHDIDFSATIADTFAASLAVVRSEMEGLDRKGSAHTSNGAKLDS